MAYKVIKANEAVTYEAPGHYDVRTTRLHNGEDVGGQLGLGLSHFLPGGGAEMANAPIELLYYIVSGEMTVTTDDGQSYCLKAGDSIHFGKGQGRESKNTGLVAAQMLVMMCPPAKA